MFLRRCFTVRTVFQYLNSVDKEEMVFLALLLLKGRNKGALPLRLITFEVIVLVATVSIVLLHCVQAMHHSILIAL